MQDASLREDLDPLLRERLRAVREVVDRTDGSVRKSQMDRRRVRHRALQCEPLAGNDRTAGQESQQVDEVARLADDATASDRGILGPVIGGDRAGVHRDHERLRRADS